MIALETRELSLRYGSHEAVRNLSLVLNRGAALVVRGPSGAGKSSLLRLIAGLERPSAGEIAIFGRTVSSVRHCEPPETRSVGMVFQDFALFPHMTVEANVGFGLRRRTAEERRSTVQNLLEQMRIAELAARYPHELSGGQQQRVALARALAPEPKLLLLDEPFASLDPRLREEVRHETFTNVKARGMTVVYVTHEGGDVDRYGDSTLDMRHV